MRIMPILKVKWWLTRKKKIQEASLNMRSAKEVLDKRDELYKLYLEVDKQEKGDKVIECRSKIQALYWVVSKIAALCIILLVTTTAYAVDSVKIEDRTTSGNRVSVEKVGPTYGISVLMGKRYMINDKDTNTVCRTYLLYA